MTTWKSDELKRIETAEELKIASLRRDGTLRNLVTIWVARLGNDLYVRSVYTKCTRNRPPRQFSGGGSDFYSLNWLSRPVHSHLASFTTVPLAGRFEPTTV
jgi:hypothetical protein